MRILSVPVRPPGAVKHGLQRQPAFGQKKLESIATFTTSKSLSRSAMGLAALLATLSPAFLPAATAVESATVASTGSQTTGINLIRRPVVDLVGVVRPEAGIQLLEELRMMRYTAGAPLAVAFMEWDNDLQLQEDLRTKLDMAAWEREGGVLLVMGSFKTQNGNRITMPYRFIIGGKLTEGLSPEQAKRLQQQVERSTGLFIDGPETHKLMGDYTLIPQALAYTLRTAKAFRGAMLEP